MEEWPVLQTDEIQYIILSLLKNMYDRVVSTVKVNNRLSSLFYTPSRSATGLQPESNIV